MSDEHEPRTVPARSPALDEQPAVIFLHIGKTGGLTLRHILNRQIPDPSRYYAERLPDSIPARHVAIAQGKAAPSSGPTRPNWFQLGELEAMSQDRRDRLRILYGHFGFGIHEILRQPATYITLLRDPVDRVLSLYQYRSSKLGLSMSLEEYVLTGLDPAFSNMQTSRVAGLGPTGDPRRDAATPEALATAKRNLERHFSVVGVAERFDEFLVLLGRTFGWTRLLYRRTNVGEGRPRREELPAGLVEKIEERNALDRELHRFADQLLDRGLREADPPVTPDDVARFRRKLALYQRVPPRVEGAYRRGKRLAWQARQRVLGR